MRYANIKWRDGQPYSIEYDDIYYSKSGGRSESEYVFIKQNGLPERWSNVDRFVVAETGFGTGLNFILTLKAWADHSVDTATLHYIGIEKHPVSPADIRRMADLHPDLSEYFEELLSVYPLPVEGVHTRTLLDGGVHLHFQFMDVIDALKNQQFAVDAWYLDGFGPAKNPELWSEKVCELVAQNSKMNATLSTYTCAGVVKRGLEAAGFEVKKVKGHGNKREMITAMLPKPSIYQPHAPWYETPAFDARSKVVTVIGAGLAGLSVAWSFVQRGWQVTVVDKYREIAHEGSGNSAGVVLPRLSVDDKSSSMFYSSAFLYAVNQLNGLQKNTHDKFWFNDGVYSISKCGKTQTIIDKHKFPEEFIRLCHNRDAPDYINPQSDDVCFYSSAGWASPKIICEVMVDVCGKSLEIITADVCNLSRSDKEWRLLNEHGKHIITSGLVVVANGVGIKSIDATSWLPVSSVRGQVTEVAASNKSRALKNALSFDAYVTPEHKGIHYVGASYSVNETTQELLDDDQNENLLRLEKTVPGLFNHPSELNGRVGFRAVSLDRMPIVGAVPDVPAFESMYADLHHGRPLKFYENGQYQPGLYVSAGHGSRGMCSCFLAAEIIASMVDGSPLPVGKKVADVINPARFLIRELKRNRPQDC